MNRKLKRILKNFISIILISIMILNIPMSNMYIYAKETYKPSPDEYIKYANDPSKITDRDVDGWAKKEFKNALPELYKPVFESWYEDAKTKCTDDSSFHKVMAMIQKLHNKETKSKEKGVLKKVKSWNNEFERLGGSAKITKPKESTTPSDTTPSDTTPSDTTPSDTTPSDTTPSDTTPSDTTPSTPESSTTPKGYQSTPTIEQSGLKRLNTMAGLAAGKNTDEIVDSYQSLTKDDLRFLGVYLSNYFQPYGTEIGLDIEEDETVKKMIDVLNKNLQFKKDIAEDLSKQLLGLMRSNYYELVFCVSQDYQSENLTEVQNINLSYGTAFQILSGRFLEFITDLSAKEQEGNRGFKNDLDAEEKKIKELLHDKSDGDSNNEDKKGDVESKDVTNRVSNPKEEFQKSVIEALKDDIGKTDKSARNYNYGYFAWKSADGTYRPVFDCYLWGDGMTPSQLAFFKALESVNFEGGYALNLFELSSDDFESDTLPADMLVSLSDAFEKNSDLANLTIWGDKLAVDAFGDLLCLGEVHKYVIVPGCMNPYIWQMVNEDGEDILEHPSGSVYNLINVPSIILQREGTDENTKGNGVGLFTNTTLATDKPGKNTIGTTTNETVETNKKTDINKKVDSATLNGCLSNSESYLNSGNIISSRLAQRLAQNTSNGLIKLYTFRGSDEISFAKGLTLGEKIKEFFTNKTKFGEILAQIQIGLFLKNATDPQIPKFSTNDVKKEDNNIENTWSSGLNITNNSQSVSIYAPLAESENIAIAKDSTLVFTDRFAFVADLSALHFDSQDNYMDWSKIQVIPYLYEDKEADKELFEIAEASRNLWVDAKSTFTSPDGKIGKNAYLTDSTNFSVNPIAMVSIYLTYGLSYLYNVDIKKETIGYLGYRMKFSDFPELSNDPIMSVELTEKIVSTRIKGWLYYLLHPSEGLNYIRILFTNKVGSALVSVHNDMLGTDYVGNTLGTTAYKSTIGYVSVPDLEEMEWSSSLIIFFQRSIPYILLIMIIILVIAFVFKIIPFFKGIIGFVLFTFCILSIVPMLGLSIGVSNNIVSTMFRDNFLYWAMISQESYSTAIDLAAQGSLDSKTEADGTNYYNYLRTLYVENSESDLGLNQGGEAVTVKWQAPKKMQSLMYTKNDTKTTKNLFSNSFLMGALQQEYSGQAFLEEDDSVYLYRSYTDLTNWSRFIYRSLVYGGTGENPLKVHRKVDAVTNLVTNMPESYIVNLKNIRTTYLTDINKGYTNDNLYNSGDVNDTVYITVPLSSSIVNSSYAQLGTISQSTELGSLYGISQDFFQFSLPMFNTKMDFHSELLEKAASDDGKKALKEKNDGGGYILGDEDFVGLAAYGLYSESPFYYFSWKLYDSGLLPESTVKGNFTNLILGKTNGGFFYNTEGNGELKDFLDMRSLFTYIIPYLKRGNDIVIEWDDYYGLKYYKGISSDEGLASQMSTTEKKQKYWNNLNTARLYNIYTHWVDSMYACSYAKEEDVQVAGETYTIKDPIDPSSYPADKGRPMIFSKSEMIDYGLRTKDLTKVEQKILEFEEKAEEVLYELTNYNVLSDVTLDTAAAMQCTFEFDKIFSQVGLSSGNIQIYPQSFEVSNFSFDAFLRFILSNSTNESILNNEDFYMTVVKSSSLVTGVGLIVADVFSLYLLPGAKLLFLALLMVSVMLLVLVLMFKVATGKSILGSIWEVVFLPLILFFIVNTCVAYIISLLMGSPNNAITGTNTMSITLGDPNTALLMIIILDAVVVVLYWKILQKVWSNTKTNAAIVATAVSSFVGSIGTSISTSVGNTVDNMTGNTKEGSSDISSVRATNRNKNDTEDKEDRLNKKRSKEANEKWIAQQEEVNRRKDKNYEEKREQQLEEITKSGKEKVIYTEDVIENKEIVGSQKKEGIKGNKQNKVTKTNLDYVDSVETSKIHREDSSMKVKNKVNYVTEDSEDSNKE